jgi:hypothetical protein
MANRRDTFAKRQRETELKERARAKQERRNAKRVEPRTNKGPEIAWEEAALLAAAGGPSPVVGPPVPPLDASDEDPADPANPADPTD